MPLKTSCFNSTIFLKNVTRFWPVWAGYTFIWVVALPFFMLSRSADLDSSMLTHWSGEYILGLSGNFSVFMALFFGILSSMAVFSYLHSGKSAGMFHSLPVRREGLFLSNYLAGLCFLIVPNVFIFLATLGAEGVMGSVNVPALATWLGVTCGLCLFFYSFAVLCAMFTGNLLFLPVLYFILNFLVVGLELLLGGVLSFLLFGYTFSGTPKTALFSPVVELVMRLRVRSVIDPATNTVKNLALEGVGIVAAYAAAGLLLALLALLLYRRRQTETAGDVVSVFVLRPVFKYGVAFAAALALGQLLFQIFHSSYVTPTAVYVLPVYLLIGGFIGYYVAEMLLQKSFRVFRKGARGCLAFAAVLVLLTAAVELDLVGYERHVPDATGVTSVTINGSATQDPIKIAEALTLHQTIVSEKRSIEETLSDFRWSQDRFRDLITPDGVPMKMARQSQTSLRIRYALKSGALMTRSYTLPVTRALLSSGTAAAARYDAWINSPEIMRSTSFPDSLTANNITSGTLYYAGAGQAVTLTEAQARALYTAITADMKAGAIHQAWPLMDETYFQTVYADRIQLDYSGRFPEKTGNSDLYSESVSFNPETTSANTLAALAALGLISETHPLTTHLEEINQKAG